MGLSPNSLPKLLRRLSLILLGMTFPLSLLRAGEEDGALMMTPPLLEGLPISDSDQGVKVTTPFLLNPTTVVPAGAILRMLYVRPLMSDDKDAKLVGADPHQGAYSRQNTPSDGGGIYVSGEMLALLRTTRTTVWPTLAAFGAALNMINSSDLRVVYKLPGATDVTDEPINFVEGIVPAEKDGTVTVLALVKGSSSEGAGFQPGDRIDEFNGTALKGSLATFQKIYDDVHTNAKIGTQKPYVFVVRHADNETPVTLTLAAPPTLGGSLLDQ